VVSKHSVINPSSPIIIFIIVVTDIATRRHTSTGELDEDYAYCVS